MNFLASSMALWLDKLRGFDSASLASLWIFGLEMKRFLRRSPRGGKREAADVSTWYRWGVQIGISNLLAVVVAALFPSVLVYSPC